MRLRQRLNESSSTERELERIFDKYQNMVNKIAERDFKKYIIPFLKERNWKFRAGNGTFLIINERENSVYREDLPKNILDILETEIPGYNHEQLGTLMPDYGE